MAGFVPGFNKGIVSLKGRSRSSVRNRSFLLKERPVGLKPRHRSFKTNEVFLLKENIYLYVAVYLCFTIYDFRFSLIPLFTRVITIKNDEIFILMIQSILHLILIIVIVILSIIKPLTSGLCLMVILVCLYLLMILRSDLLLYKLWYK